MGLYVLLYGFARKTLLDRFTQLEKQELRQDLDRVSHIITNEYELLATTARDDSQWDEAYRFVKHPTANWGENNFTNDTFSALRLNLIIYIDDSDRPVHAR